MVVGSRTAPSEALSPWSPRLTFHAPMPLRGQVTVLPSSAAHPAAAAPGPSGGSGNGSNHPPGPYFVSHRMLLVVQYMPLTFPLVPSWHIGKDWSWQSSLITQAVVQAAKFALRLMQVKHVVPVAQGWPQSD